MKLTQEQIDILEQVVQGRTNMQIAEHLGYSERSVKRKLQKLFRFFKVENRAALATSYMATKFADWIE